MIRIPRAAGRCGAPLVLAALVALQAAGAPAAPVPSHDRRFSFDDTKPGLDSPASGSRLVLVREQMVRKNPMPPERLYLDGRPLGYLPQRSVVAADVTPGLHRLEGVLGCPPLVIEFEPGERVLLRLREVIDERDAVRARWLLEDPDFAAELLESMELLHASVTPRGVAELERRWRTVDVGRPADSIRAPRDSSSLVFPEIWFEHPLDPLNLRREFTTHSGRLEIGPEGISYTLDRNERDLRVTIPHSDVLGVRFGGTRSAGVAPWIDLFYRSGERTLRASFADAGPDPEAAYNRMFGAIRARWVAARRGAANAAGDPGGR